MKINNRLPLQRLIGKIDNDFNISESDWIPRVAAWVTDALSQMKVLPMEKKKRELEVSNRIAQFPCELNASSITVLDEDGNEIQSLTKCKNCPKYNKNSKEIAVIDVTNKTGVNFMNICNIINPCCSKNFIIQGNNIELNFDADSITVESYEVATYFDEYYQTYVPYIYDDGLLLEALAWYCLFKYLSRGSHHQVYDLKSPNQVVNPYLQWMALKVKAANSVKINMSNDRGWNNFFYNSTFRPRD